MKNKRIELLHQLSQETEAISLPKLLSKIEGNYAERTIRRWLVEMINEGLVEKIGEKKGAKYQIKNKSKIDSVSTHGFFTSRSLRAIEKIKKPLYERKPVSYEDHFLDSYNPNRTHYISIDLRRELQHAGKRSKKEDPAGTYAHQIFNRLLIDLSYNSSRLEGNTYSLLDTERLVLEGASVAGKLDEEKIMILNHKEAIRYLVDNAPRIKISEQTICTVHYLLSEGLIDAQYSGKIRDYGVRIGGSTYIPFEDKKQLQVRFTKILEKAGAIENPFEQSFFLLVHISYLQGFSDVNKRTARLSANIPLIKNNLVPLSFNDVEKEDYTSAIISIYELQDVQPLLDLYLFSYMRTCALYDSTVKALGFDEIRVRYRQQRREIIRHIILKKLKGKTMHNYISEEMKKLINEEDQELFLEDVREDLRELDEVRIAGLGITVEQLSIWKNYKKST